MDRLFKIRCSAIGKIMSNAKVKGELSETCKTYLKEWYANVDKNIQSKYLDKGIICEDDAIDLMARVLNMGIVTKNQESLDDEYFTGTCDVNEEIIVDIKCPWDKKTFNDQMFKLDSDYEYQLRGYMHLYKKSKAVLFYALMDTPEELNGGIEVVYSDLDDSERWYGFEVTHDQSIVDAIIERVKQCREWLDQYDASVKLKLGRISQ